MGNYFYKNNIQSVDANPNIMEINDDILIINTNDINNNNDINNINTNNINNTNDSWDEIGKEVDEFIKKLNENPSTRIPIQKMKVCFANDEDW